jgi:DNA-directed RNA polymerase subunit RPC12/RpoP
MPVSETKKLMGKMPMPRENDMSITFRCEHCRKDVQAPESAAGKRGKCPYCGHSSYIPAPVSDDDLLPLAPVDEEEEQRRQQEVRQLFEQERDLIAQTGSKPDVPLDQREDVKPEDLHHFIVNYCLDMSVSKLPQADKQVAELRKQPLGLQAVQDFLAGKAMEPALKAIPPRLLQAFLLQLRDKLKT